MQELLSTGDLFVSSIRVHEELEPSGLSVLNLDGPTLIKIADRMNLRLTEHTRSLDAARLAPERAHLLWLGYVEARTRRRMCDSLFAAYQAWNAIERARPLPF